MKAPLLVGLCLGSVKQMLSVYVHQKRNECSPTAEEML